MNEEQWPDPADEVFAIDQAVFGIVMDFAESADAAAAAASLDAVLAKHDSTQVVLTLLVGQAARMMKRAAEAEGKSVAEFARVVSESNNFDDITRRLTEEGSGDAS